VEQNGAIGVKIVEEESRESLSNTIQEFPAVDKENDTVIVKINLKRTDIAELVEHVTEETNSVMVLLGNGVIYLKFPIGSDTGYQQLANTLTQLRQYAIDIQGNLIIEAAPPELKKQMDVWGPIGSTLNLMKQVKMKFDGGGVFNPGRFVAKI
jgi:glycolate oxidase FAD binding subunit